MKIFATLIISLFLISNCFSQYSVNIDTFEKQELPTWFIYKGDTVGLVFSVQQAQKIDSDLELLYWLEKKGFTCDSTISTYIKVVDEMNKQITIFKTTVKELDSKSQDKDIQINNLKNQILNKQNQIDLANKQIDGFGIVTENNNLRISNLKTQRNLWIGGGFLSTAAAVLVTILILK